MKKNSVGVSGFSTTAGVPFPLVVPSKIALGAIWGLRADGKFQLEAYQQLVAKQQEKEKKARGLHRLPMLLGANEANCWWE